MTAPLFFKPRTRAFAGQEKAGLPLPQNDDHHHDPNQDKLLRRLDNALIRHVHTNVDEEYATWTAEGQRVPTPQEPFDTVRGLFPEGEPAYEGGGILTKTHTQLAVRTPECVIGVFRLLTRTADMRTQDQNPAFQRFRHLLPDGGLYPSALGGYILKY